MCICWKQIDIQNANQLILAINYVCTRSVDDVLFETSNPLLSKGKERWRVYLEESESGNKNVNVKSKMKMKTKELNWKLTWKRKKKLFLSRKGQERSRVYLEETFDCCPSSVLGRRTKALWGKQGPQNHTHTLSNTQTRQTQRYLDTKAHRD